MPFGGKQQPKRPTKRDHRIKRRRMMTRRQGAVAPATNRDERFKQVVEEARFLLARLDDINLDDDTDDLIRDWNGHVEPSIARLRSLVGAA